MAQVLNATVSSAEDTRQTEGTHSGAHWGSGTLEHCLLYIQRALATSWLGWRRLGTGGTDNQTHRVHITVGHAGALSTVSTEGTDNQSDWVHTVGRCQLYIQRAQTTSQTRGTQWGTLEQRAQTTRDYGPTALQLPNKV